MARSHSALESFLKCERRYYFERVAKLEQPPSHYLSIGLLYHEAIAAALVAPTVNLDTLLRRHKEKPGWSCKWADSDILRGLTANIARLRTSVFPHIKPLVIEKKVAERGFYGVLDVVSSCRPITDESMSIIGTDESRSCVLDWKVKFSNRGRRDQKSADTSQQLAIYALMSGKFSAGFIEIPVEVSEPINVIMTDFSELELERWERYLKSQFVAIESRGADPTAYRLAEPSNALCSERWCPFFGRCPGGSYRG